MFLASFACARLRRDVEGKLERAQRLADVHSGRKQETQGWWIWICDTLFRLHRLSQGSRSSSVQTEAHGAEGAPLIHSPVPMIVCAVLLEQKLGSMLMDGCDPFCVRILPLPHSATSGVDYWQGVLRSLNVYEARAKLRELHVMILEKSLEKLEARKDALRRARLAETGAAGLAAEEAAGMAADM
jgi:hypothetical protein